MSRVHPAITVLEDDGLRNDNSGGEGRRTGAIRQRRRNGVPTDVGGVKNRSSRKKAIDYRPQSAIKNIFVQSSAERGPLRDLRSASHRQTPGLRTVSLFWREKVLVVFDALQIMGLFWKSSRAWPEQWRMITQFSAAFSGDFLSIINYNSNKGNSLPHDWNTNATSYAALSLTTWCLLPLLVRIAKHYCCTRCTSSSRDATTKTLLFEELIYLPVLLSLLYLISCQGELDTAGSLNDTLECWCWWENSLVFTSWTLRSWVLLAVTVIAFLAAVEFLIRVPLMLLRHANEVHIYSTEKRHERYLCAKELEYLLHINTDYEDEHFQTVASYRRHTIHQKERVIVLKFVLTAFTTVSPVFFLSDWIIVFHAVVLLGWSIIQTISMPFRCQSTNRLHCTLLWMLTAFSGLGALRQRGLYSSVTSDDFLSLALTYTGICCLCVSFLVAFAHPIASDTERWPLVKSCLQNIQHTTNPKNRKTMVASHQLRSFATHGIEFRKLSRPESRCCRFCIQSWRRFAQSYRLVVGHTGNDVIDNQLRRWLTSIGQGQDLLLKCAFTQREFLPINELDDHIEVVRQAWSEALTQRHILTDTLRELLEELIAKCEGGRHASILSSGLFNENEANKFSDLVVSRERDMILLDPKIRRVLQKLVSMRMWIGNRKIKSLPMDDTGVSFKLMPQASAASLSRANKILYSIWFRSGPLHLSVVQSIHDELLIDGFSVSTNGRPGPAEICGYVHPGDCIVAVNGIDLTSMDFAAACQTFGSASWPRTLVFRRPVRAAQLESANRAIIGYLQNQQDKLLSIIPDAEPGKSIHPRDLKNVESAEDAVSSMTSWKDMLEHHTQQSMTVDEIVDFVAGIGANKANVPSEERLQRMEQQLTWFINQWEKDFSEHHDRESTDKDRKEIQHWFMALHKLRTHMR